MPAREKHLHIYLVQYQKKVCFRGIRNKVGTVRPQDTRPQAARTLQVHVFE